MLTEQRFARSEQVVWEKGLLALVQALGYGDALRFISRIVPGYGDYLAQQDQIFGDATVDEIYAQAQDYWTAKNESSLAE